MIYQIVDKRWVIESCRFVVEDTEGPLRRFFSLDEAKRFIGTDTTLTIRVLPKPKRKRLDLSQFEEAPF
jgi:hypothetical protein